MGIFDFLFGQGEGYNKVPTKTKGQEKQLNQALEQWQGLAGSGYEDAIGLLQSLLDPNSQTYQNFAQPYMDQFQQQIIPGIKEQFAGLNGMGGGLASSGFAQSLGAAGAGLTNQLAQLREGLRLQGAQGILGQYNQGFGQTQQQQPFAYGQKSPGLLQSLAPGFGQGIGSAATNYYMNRGVGGNDQGRGYQAQPLTNQLDTMYRQSGMMF